MLTTQDLLLRQLEPSDLEVLYQWENDVALLPYRDDLNFYSRAQLEQYILSAGYNLTEAGQQRFMIQLKQRETIGCIDFFDFNAQHKRAGIGILIGEMGHWGKGYATQALEAALHFAFKDVKLHQVFCNISQSNERSRRLFEKSGFSLVGEKKEWLYQNKGYESEFLFQRLNPYQ